MGAVTYPPPLFAGLVYNETGEPVEITYIGTEPHYVIMDGDFRRHVATIIIDRQVIAWIQAQATANKELVSENIMAMMGKDDLFTKAMIDSSLSHMDRVMEHGLPEDARMMLGMMGFKIVVNLHGELVNLDMPGQEIADDEEW
jgi:hypothetical protein